MLVLFDAPQPPTYQLDIGGTACAALKQEIREAIEDATAGSGIEVAGARRRSSRGEL